MLALFTERPYVVAFLVAFVCIATAERGWVKMLLWLISGTLIGWLAEFASINTGFPFGDYAYHADNFPTEVWLKDVPLFASLSFAFMSYFAHSTACTIVGDLRGTGRQLTRLDEVGRNNPLGTLLLAALLTVWVDAVIDPLTLLGRYWFLGDLYHYEGRSFHFGVPLSNYLGWFFTTTCIVFTNQCFDRWLKRYAAHGILTVPFKALLAPLCVAGQFVFLIVVNLLLMSKPGVPADTPLGQMLFSGLFLFGGYLLLLLLKLRWSRPRPPG